MRRYQAAQRGDNFVAPGCAEVLDVGGSIHAWVPPETGEQQLKQAHMVLGLEVDCHLGETSGGVGLGPDAWGLPALDAPRPAGPMPRMQTHQLPDAAFDLFALGLVVHEERSPVDTTLGHGLLEPFIDCI